MLSTLNGKIVRSHPYSLDKTLTVEGTAAEAKATGEAIEKVKTEAMEYTNSLANRTDNPNNVTAGQVGLGNVDNTSDLDKPVSTAQAAAIKAVSDEAKTLVNAKAETGTYKGTFLTNGWNDSAPYTQTITVTGILSTDYPFVDIDLSGVSTEGAVSIIEAWKLVGRVTVSAANKVTMYCYEEKPTVDIPVIFKVVR